jgi:glycoprotein endo-alpha-1,2-mannosidase
LKPAHVVLLVAAVLAGSDAWGGRPFHDFTTGVYYYPWHATDFHGGKYLREFLVPPQLPELGEYNDRDPAVIAQHLAWSRQAGVDFWVASWWGPGSREDVTLLGTIMPHPDLGDIKIALFYETTGLTNNFTDFSTVGSHITYAATNYFGHPNYLRIDGKPVIFVYLTRVLSAQGALQSTVDTMRTAATAAGYSVYIVGDQVFGSAPGDGSGFAMLDAVTNYDVYGSMGVTGYAGQTAVNNYYAAQGNWRNLAHGVGLAFIPAVTPGFNDKGVRDGHEPVSRKLTAGSEFGSLFRAMLHGAKPLADPQLGHMLMVTSWNEWHEDTQIEPVALAPATNVDVSGTQAYTRGLDYEGYGTRYLDILEEETVPPAELAVAGPWIWLGILVAIAGGTAATSVFVHRWRRSSTAELGF